MLGRRPVSRIGRLQRALVLLDGAIIVATMAVVLVADFAGSFSLVAMAVDFGSAAVPCNRALGARTIFLALLVIELFAVAKVVSLRRSSGDVEAYLAEFASVVPVEKWRTNLLVRLRLVFAVVAFSLITLWGSYHLAFGDAAICTRPISASLRDYWFMLAVNAGRVMCLFLAIHLSFMPAGEDV